MPMLRACCSVFGPRPGRDQRDVRVTRTLHPGEVAVAGIGDPAAYEAWYHTARGAWIGNLEFRLLMRLLRPGPSATLLDVGSGTGYFSRRFAVSPVPVYGLRALILIAGRQTMRAARVRRSRMSRATRGICRFRSVHSTTWSRSPACASSTIRGVRSPRCGTWPVGRLCSACSIGTAGCFGKSTARDPIAARAGTR